MSIKQMYTQRKVDEYKYPEVIPESCKQCKYFKKTGIIDIYRGHCHFFNEDRFSNWSCIVYDYIRFAKDVNLKVEIEKNIKERLLPQKKLIANGKQQKLQKKKHITSIGLSFFYCILVVLYYTNVPTVEFFEETRPHFLGVSFAASTVILSFLSAFILDSLIFSKRSNFWRWRIGIIFGAIGILSLHGSIRQNPVFETIFSMIIYFWLFTLVGYLIGWPIDIWLKRRAMRRKLDVE